MKWAVTGAVFAVATAAGAAASSPLAGYIDRARVLVIAATGSDDLELRRQDAALARSTAALAERQVAIVRIVGATALDERGGRLDAAAVRAATKLSDSRFGVALIGKDGGVKLVRREAISVRELVETIDAMPMRRREMRGAAP